MPKFYTLLKTASQVKRAQFLNKLNQFQFEVKFVNLLYLLLVFAFVTCEKEKYSYLERQEYCLPIVRQQNHLA